MLSFLTVGFLSTIAPDRSFCRLRPFLASGWILESLILVKGAHLDICMICFDIRWRTKVNPHLAGCIGGCGTGHL
jgi:hypothetical protein